jgi:regulator of sirC expression with transglutaminase-like and TPR domain
MTGHDSELLPEHYMPVSDRDVLLRLQNNLKARLIQAQRLDRALQVIETMLLLAPDLADLWREAGVMQARLGNLRAAVASLEGFISRAADDAARHQAAALVQQLKAQMN